MKVQDIMSMSIVTCSVNDTLESVAQKLWEHDCGCLPVVDRENRPLAMITDRDVCMAAYTTGKPLAALRVASAMSKGLAVCRVQEDLSMAAARMAKRGVRRLPVVDAAGKLVGLVSLNDFVTAMVEQGPPGATTAAAAETLQVLQAVCHHRTGVPQAVAEPEAGEATASV
jgi:CBS domain-containing protein